jgi:hypothetical protein
LMIANPRADAPGRPAGHCARSQGGRGLNDINVVISVDPHRIGERASVLSTVRDPLRSLNERP